MHRWIDLVLYTILFTLLSVGCRPQPATPKLIFNIPGPEVPLYHSEWELYEHHFPMELSPKEASTKLEKLGYRFLTPDEESLAQTFVWQQSHIVTMSLALIYLDHPIVVFFQPENTKSIYIVGFDQGMFPRPLRGFYEHARLGEEYGWLVMREKSFDR